MKLLASLILVTMFSLTGCAHSAKSCCSDKTAKSCDGKSCELKKGENKKSCCQ